MTIYQITNELLIESFNKNSCECDFDETLTRELMCRIASFDKGYKTVDMREKEQIRRAFSDFFIECGKVVVFFKGTERIIIKIIPYRINPYEKEYTEKIYSYLKSVIKNIKNENKDDNVIKISEKYSSEIDHTLKTISTPTDTRKIIRSALVKAFDLAKKDIILFINNNIIIRRFCEREPCERRFEGLPPTEIKKIVDDLYSNTDDLQTDIEMIISSLADATLSFAKIDNGFFESNYVKIVQSAIIDFMKKKLSHPMIIITAVSNYILRNSFVFVHEILAEKLLELVENRNKNAEIFLRYYKGDIAIENGRKYITHEIIDSTAQKWNTSMIINFILQYKKEKKNLKEKISALKMFKIENEEIGTKLDVLRSRDKTMQNELQEALKKSQRLANELDKNRNSLKETRRAALHSEKGAGGLAENLEKNTKALSLNNQEFQKFVQELKQKYQTLQKDIKNLEKREEFLIKQIELETKNLELFQKKFEKQEEKYDLLLFAVSHVLMKKRQPI